MAHTYLLFDFGSEDEAQQARHKLENWKQAFRLDKKLLYKLDRAEAETSEALPAEEANEDAPAATSKPAKGAAKSGKAAKSAAKSPAKAKSKAESDQEPAATSNGKVGLIVRLYFSGHEKLTEQRLLDRFPTEEPFKDASPRVIRQGEPQFDELVQQFESLE